MASESSSYEARKEPADREPDGPFLVAALLCERVIEEKDGSVSAIRVVDEIRLDLETPEPGAVQVVVPLSLALLVAIRSAEIDRMYELSITLRTPSGKRRRLSPPGRLQPRGSVAGANFIAKMQFATNEEGTHYFDIELDNRFLTRVPLNVVVTTHSATAD
jgi:hypothetical protein